MTTYSVTLHLRGIVHKTGQIILLGSLLLLPTLTQADKSALTDKLTVVPGQRIGQVRLHKTLRAVEQRIGPSTFGDSALGHYWRTWQACSEDAHTDMRYDLDVYAIVNAINGLPDIRIIRVTSPLFHTDNGIACGSTLAQIQKRYSKARRIARYLSPQVSKPVVIYDAKSQGIAFEVACDKEGKVQSASSCVALLVHVAGKHSVQDECYHLTTYEVSKPSLVIDVASQNPERKQ